MPVKVDEVWHTTALLTQVLVTVLHNSAPPHTVKTEAEVILCQSVVHRVDLQRGSMHA